MVLPGSFMYAAYTGDSGMRERKSERGEMVLLRTTDMQVVIMYLISDG